MAARDVGLLCLRHPDAAPRRGGIKPCRWRARGVRSRRRAGELVGGWLDRSGERGPRPRGYCLPALRAWSLVGLRRLARARAGRDADEGLLCLRHPGAGRVRAHPRRCVLSVQSVAAPLINVDTQMTLPALATLEHHVVRFVACDVLRGFATVDPPADRVESGKADRARKDSAIVFGG